VRVSWAALPGLREAREGGKTDLEERLRDKGGRAVDRGNGEGHGSARVVARGWYCCPREA